MNSEYQDNDIHLQHYGMPFRSGRYPWGSGDTPFQRSGDFLSRVDELRKEGMTFTDSDGKTWTGDTAIAKSFGLTTTRFRTLESIAGNERRARDIDTVKSLREDGLSYAKIAEKLGYPNESSIRSLLDEKAEARMNEAMNTYNLLKKHVDERGMIDVGAGVERQLGISSEKLKQALYMLELEGYEIYGGGVPQINNKGQQTNMKVLCPPGTEHKDIYEFDKINYLDDVKSHDGGQTFDPGFVYPASLDSKRLAIRYDEEGGSERDGVIELRRNVEDISLGGSTYAQVRILVDGNKYIKGMAVYSDDLPDGVDIRFNTNKKIGTSMGDVLKDITSDPDNPFGSLIKQDGQRYYIDANGKKQLSVINKRAEEGDWADWADKLPSQFLSKQSESLMKQQLRLDIANKQAELDEILSLTNPTVKKALLQSFSDDCDSAAVHLQAASLPRQKYQVLLPISTLKDTEVYAPNYKNGEKVALIRFPHGGTFEIPILTVNNKHADSQKVMGKNPLDAIGINSKVAARLSGADFDGDAVMVIPTGNKVKITSTPPLKDLEGFDPRMTYPPRQGMKIMSKEATANEMGKISNLITDMTLQGATQKELARAVKHSMVVIDAAKHKLDYKQSEQDNSIASLKTRYQGRVNPEGVYTEGAATLLSKAKSQASVVKRQGSPIIDPNTGAKTWKTVDDPTYVDYKTGEIKTRMQRSTKMAETDDARTLISDANTRAERAYAEYANASKTMANQARKEMVNTGKIEYSPTANKTYANEVNSLKSQLNVALKNAPKERQAQTIANSVVNAKKKANPDLKAKELSKLSQQELNRARLSVGAKRTNIKVGDKEWEAIQAGAISENVLKKIINNINIDDLRERATPRTRTVLSASQINKISAMKASGYSNEEIASALNVSTSTVAAKLSGKE